MILYWLVVCILHWLLIVLLRLFDCYGLCSLVVGCFVLCLYLLYCRWLVLLLGLLVACCFGNWCWLLVGLLVVCLLVVCVYTVACDWFVVVGGRFVARLADCGCTW